jgi:P27 family predicted phage terminase small subunit
MKAKSSTLKAASAPPKPPSHLKTAERAMWRDLTSEHEFTDAASLALLRVALEAHGRARECRETIEKDGQTFRDRFNQIRLHPLIAAERDARASFISAVKALNLDLVGD